MMPGIKQINPPAIAAAAMATISAVFPESPSPREAAQAATAPIKNAPSMDRLKSPGLKRMMTASPVNINGVIPSMTFPKRRTEVSGPKIKSPRAERGWLLIRRMIAKTMIREIRMAIMVRSIST